MNKGIYDLRQGLKETKILEKISDAALAYWSASASLITNSGDRDAKIKAKKIIDEISSDPEIREKLPDFIKASSDQKHLMLIDTAGIIITSKRK